MQEPSYHLEAVVKSRDEREDFTGPLDVILMLLAKNKIEIRDIQISLLLEQYLAYLAARKEMDLDIASEFVQMASQLMYIKTRMLLAGEEEEITELETLVSALEQLQNRDILAAIKGAAPELDARSRAGFCLHTREPSPLPGRPYQYRHTGAELFRALSGMLLRAGGTQPDESGVLQSMPRPIAYGIREKSRQLTALLAERGWTLRELYALCASRSELVATFLAVLELCAAGEMRIERDGDDYTVSHSAPQE